VQWRLLELPDPLSWFADVTKIEASCWYKHKYDRFVNFYYHFAQSPIIIYPQLLDLIFKFRVASFFMDATYHYQKKIYKFMDVP